MTSPTQIVWQLHGSPAVENEVEHEPAHCWCCAAVHTRGVDRDKWLTKTLTDQNTARCATSPWVCSACVCMRARFSPIAPRPAKDGKQAPRWSNFSHLYDSAEKPAYVNASKGEKPLILAFLRRHHSGDWFAAIADSGQKHVLQYAPINPASEAYGGCIKFEEQDITLPSSPDGWRIVDAMCALLTAGATKAEVETGQYNPGTYIRCGDDVLSFEEAHGAARGSAWFTMCVWLSQRDEDDVAERMAAEKEAKKSAKQGPKGNAKNADRGADARPEGDVPAHAWVQRPEALDDARKQGAISGQEGGKRRGVGHAYAARATAAGPQQRSLFELD